MSDFNLEKFNRVLLDFDAKVQPDHLNKEAQWQREMRAKWELLCFEQQGFLPKVRSQIPNEWRTRKIKRMSWFFLDCMREPILEEIEIEEAA